MILKESARALVDVLFPQFAGVVIERIEAIVRWVWFEVSACSAVPYCPTSGSGRNGCTAAKREYWPTAQWVSCGGDTGADAGAAAVSYA